MLSSSAKRGTFRHFSTTLQCLRSLIGDHHHECAFPIAGKSPKKVSLKDAFDEIKAGDQIFVQAMAPTPTPLLDALCDYAAEKNVSNLTLHHLLLGGPSKWLEPKYNKLIRSNSLFTGANLRKGLNDGLADYTSCFLHEVPLLFRRGVIKLNVALIQVSPPDSKGFCSLGPSVDVVRAAITNADHIIAMTNKEMPRTFGDGLIHESHIDAMVTEADGFPLYEIPPSNLTAAEEKIGELIANNLVDDGATLQMGIGGVPDAALKALKNHKDLGIHTEMFSDGILDLIDCNAITNARKNVMPGKIVTSFVYGSKKLYDFLDNNPMVYFGDAQWCNDPATIRQNPKVTAINSAVEVDMTGQVVADSVGKRFLSGVGGQLDFIRGAAVGNDGLGKPIIALPSITKKGESKIVPFLQEGSGVVTTRSHINYVVTENGIAQLWGKNMRQRAYELIKIAHPSHRESLEKAAFERLKVMPSAD